MSYPKKINPEILRLQLKLLKYENQLNELLLLQNLHWTDEISIRILSLQVRDIRAQIVIASQY